MRFRFWQEGKEVTASEKIYFQNAIETELTFRWRWLGGRKRTHLRCQTPALFI